MPSADRRTAGRAGNLCRRRTVWHDVVAGVPGDATWPARSVLMLLGPVSVVIGVLAAMLPAPILTGDTAAIAAVMVPLLASLAAAALAVSYLVGLVVRPLAAPRTGPKERRDVPPHWLRIDLPHRPERPRAPGRR